MKLRILFITDTLGFGGAQKVLLQHMNYIRSQGHEVGLFSIKKNSYHHWFDSHQTYGAIEDKESISKNLFFVLEELKQIASCYDVIIGFMDLFTNYIAVMIGKMLRKTTLVSSRIMLSEHLVKIDIPSVNKNLITYFYNQADGVIALSKEVAKDLEETYEINPLKIFQLYNPINFEKVEKLTSQCMCNEGLKRCFEQRVLVSVGRLVEQKNHKILISVFQKISQEYKDTLLVIFGEGPLKQELIQLRDSLGLEKRVLLCGNVENIYPYLAKAEIFVFPSIYEGLGNVLLEAMSVGVPIVASDLNVIKELIIDRENGLLVESNDETMMLAAIRELLEDTKLANKLGATAKESIKSMDIEIIGNELLQIIKKVHLYA